MRRKTVTPASASRAPRAAKVKLLAGGNPQIAMADGDAPVRAFIAASPGWKRLAAKRLDACIVKAFPKVAKAVKWNSPMYGVAGEGFFVSFHLYERFIKVLFFKGSSLEPMPPVASKVAGNRYVHITEEGFDEAQMTRWVKQAAKLPGWVPGRRAGG